MYRLGALLEWPTYLPALRRSRASRALNELRCDSSSLALVTVAPALQVESVDTRGRDMVDLIRDTVCSLFVFTVCVRCRTDPPTKSQGELHSTSFSAL